MEGRVSVMTAITPIYAHAYQSIYLTGRHVGTPHQQFRSPAVRVKYPHLPNSRTTTRQKGMISRIGLSIPMEELACLMVKPWLAGVLLLVHLMEEWCLPGHKSSSHEHSTWAPLSTFVAASPTHATFYHATRLQSCAKLRKRMCGSCCCSRFLWIGVEQKLLKHVGHIRRLTPIMSSRPVKTLTMCYKNCAISEQRVCLPRNVTSEVSVVSS